MFQFFLANSKIARLFKKCLEFKKITHFQNLITNLKIFKNFKRYSLFLKFFWNFKIFLLFKKIPFSKNCSHFQKIFEKWKIIHNFQEIFENYKKLDISKKIILENLKFSKCLRFQRIYPFFNHKIKKMFMFPNNGHSFFKK